MHDSIKSEKIHGNENCNENIKKRFQRISKSTALYSNFLYFETRFLGYVCTSCCL